MTELTMALVGAILTNLATLGTVAKLVMSGTLVPRQTHVDLLNDRNEWRTLALQAMSQNGTLLQAAKVTTKVVEVLGAGEEQSE